MEQVDCPRCGAPKRLPSKTAYLYRDHCESLMDHDLRLANFGTNGALTNQVYLSGIECPYCQSGTHRI